MTTQWRSKGRDYIYEARTPDEITVVREKVSAAKPMAPSEEFDFIYVHSPYQVVFIVALNEHGEVALLRQYRHVIRRELLEVPAGSPEPGEALEAGALREFEEETGLEVTNIRRLASFFPSVGITDQVGHVFVGCVDSSAAPSQPRELRATLEWHDLSRAADLARKGAFENVGTAYAILLAEAAARPAPD